MTGLILRGAWANGKVGPMNALKNVLISDKLKVDPDRQLRVWSGTLRDDKDFEDAVLEIIPFYAPPDRSPPPDTPAKPEGTEFLGVVKFYSETQNYAFSVNMPRFDVRDQLHLIKVGRITT